MFDECTKVNFLQNVLRTMDGAIQMTSVRDKDFYAPIQRNNILAGELMKTLRQRQHTAKCRGPWQLDGVAHTLKKLKKDAGYWNKGRG